MTLLNTAEGWRDNILWVNENKRSLDNRNATIPKENSKSGATMERFYKRYIHSLVALSFTDEYQYILDEHNTSDLLINSVNQYFISDIRYDKDSKLNMFDLFTEIPALKKRHRIDNFYSQLFQDEIFNVKSKALKFVLYFMTSFYNLNDLFNDYVRIFKKRKKEKYELWEKTAYFNQTIAEIYREDFFFTMLLEVLNLVAISNGQFTVKDIVKIYNGYLKDKPIDKDDFSYKYLYDLQHNSFIEENEAGEEIYKWFGKSIWEKKVDGEIILTSSKTTNQSVVNFKIPEEISCLNPAEINTALKLIVDLFVININYDAVSDDLQRNDNNFMPSDVTKETLNIQKEFSKTMAIHRISNRVFYKRENEFHISQHRKTLFQSERDENFNVSHYILNPKIPQLVNNISKKGDVDDLHIDFIRVLT